MRRSLKEKENLNGTSIAIAHNHYVYSILMRSRKLFISALHFSHLSRNSFSGNGPFISQLISPFLWTVKQHVGYRPETLNPSRMISSSAITLSNRFLRLVMLIPSCINVKEGKYIDTYDTRYILKPDTPS